MTESDSTKHNLNYYFDFRGIDDFQYEFDEIGIPLVNIDRSGFQYNPVTIAQYGLYELQMYTRNSSETHVRVAQLCADWLVEQLRPFNKIEAWVHDFQLPFYGPTAPWISGMAQGEGISLLLRMYDLSGKKTYRSVAKLAFQAFRYTVEEGGVVDTLTDGTLMFEEFPTNPPSHVLNGHIFALLGVYDYANYLKDENARKLFETCARDLAENLDDWDNGYWCFYDLYHIRRLASHLYMRVHIQLLNILFDLTRNYEFSDYARRWQSYLKNPVSNTRWLGQKVFEKVCLKQMSGK